MVKTYVKRSRKVYRAHRRGMRGAGRYAAKLTRFSYTRSKTGFMKVERKCPEVFIQNAAVAGTVSVTDMSTASFINVGTPVSTGFANTYDVPFACRFSLLQILNSTDITNLCDRYKLKKTVIRVYFNSNNNSIQSQSSLPQLSYNWDDDDNTVPTPAALREKMGTKIKYFTNKNMIKITVYPKVANSLFNNGVLSGAGVAKPQWINSTYPNVDHYGLKGVIQNVNLPASPSFAVGFKMDVTHTLYGADFQ